MTKEKQDKYDKIIQDKAIRSELPKLPKEERIELKSYAIKKALKLKKYVRN